MMIKLRTLIFGVVVTAAAICALALLAACATLSMPAQLKAGYDTVTAYQAVVTQALDRDRITAAQGEQALANSRKAKATLDQARIVLAGCKPDVPCTEYADLMQALQPSLLELERQLRARELAGAAK
jgi:hypothetical protein